MMVQVGDVRYHLRRSGAGTSRPPVLLLHGFMGSLDMWQPWWEDWGRTYDLLAVDFLGHGQSSRRHLDPQAGMETTVDDLMTILEGLQVANPHLIGYSMGGRVALAVAARYPERVGRILMESGSPGLQDAKARAARQQEDERRAVALETRGMGPFVEAWAQLPLFASQTRLPMAVRDRIRQSRLNNAPAGLAASLRELGTGRQASYWSSLAGLGPRLGVVAGALDSKFVSVAQAVAAAAGQAWVVVVEDAGHAVHLEQPERFNQVVKQFLRET